MEKISFVKKEHKHDLEVPKLANEIMKIHANEYDKILKQAIENYLGRPIDLANDTKRILLIEMPDGYKNIMIDNINIGTIGYCYGLSDNDFSNNRITFKTSFTPNVKL